MHSPAPLPDLEPVTLEPGSVALIGGGLPAGAAVLGVEVGGIWHGARMA